MSRLPDLTGHRFGHLTVVEQVRIKRGIAYICDCDCGRQCRKMGYDLASGKATQCTSMNHYWIGQRFGRLTALHVDPDHKIGNTALIVCRCDCGNMVSVQLGALTHGKQRSCGCLHSEAAAKQIATHIKEANKRRYVDGTSLSNLSRKPTNKSTTGVRGVYLRRDRHDYIAFICFKGHTYYLGTWASLVDAAAARRIAERTLFDPMREKHGLPPLSNKEARSILDAALDRLRKANKHKEGDHDAD